MKQLVGSRPFAYVGQGDSDKGNLETVNFVPHASLNAMLDDFIAIGQDKIEVANTRLSELFCNQMARLLPVRIPAFKRRGGIVSVIYDKPEQLAADLRACPRRVIVQPLRTTIAKSDSIAKDELGLVRICFHYNMGEWDVSDLVYEIGKAMASK